MEEYNYELAKQKRNEMFQNLDKNIDNLKKNFKDFNNDTDIPDEIKKEKLKEAELILTQLLKDSSKEIEKIIT